MTHMNDGRPVNMELATIAAELHNIGTDVERGKRNYILVAVDICGISNRLHDIAVRKAAPQSVNTELLEACRELLDLTSNLHEPDGSPDPEVERINRRARAAVRKAEATQ